MGRKLKAAIAGLGSRGKDAYVAAARLFPDKMEIAAIADTDPAKVLETAREYHVPEETCFASAEEMLAQDRLADVMIIATQDRQHERVSPVAGEACFAGSGGMQRAGQSCRGVRPSGCCLSCAPVCALLYEAERNHRFGCDWRDCLCYGG